MTLRPHGIILGIVLAWLSWTPANASDTAAAESFISDLGDQTIEILQQPDLTIDEAAADFRALFSENFDIPTIGRFALGRYWRAATPSQREEFLMLFRELIVETYARRFSEYSGQSIEVLGSRELSERDAMVETRIVDVGGGTIAAIEWRVRARDGRQRIIDVVVEQISMGVTQRSDFDAVIQRGGGDIDTLLDALRDQISLAQNP